MIAKLRDPAGLRAEDVDHPLTPVEVVEALAVDGDDLGRPAGPSRPSPDPSRPKKIIAIGTHYFHDFDGGQRMIDVLRAKAGRVAELGDHGVLGPVAVEDEEGHRPAGLRAEDVDHPLTPVEVVEALAVDGDDLVGRLVLAIDGQRFHDFDGGQRMIDVLRAKAGATVTLLVLHSDGTEDTVIAKLRDPAGLRARTSIIR